MLDCVASAKSLCCCDPQDGSGEIELDEFLQMMAPKVLLGPKFLSCPKSLIGSLAAYFI